MATPIPYQYNATTLGNITNYVINFDDGTKSEISKNLNISNDLTLSEIDSASKIISSLSESNYTDTTITSINKTNDKIEFPFEAPSEEYKITSSNVAIVRYINYVFAKMPSEYFNQTGGTEYWGRGIINGRQTSGGVPRYLITSILEESLDTSELTSGEIHFTSYKLFYGSESGNTTIMYRLRFALINNPQPIGALIKFKPLIFVNGEFKPIEIKIRLK